MSDFGTNHLDRAVEAYNVDWPLRDEQGEPCHAPKEQRRLDRAVKTFDKLTTAFAVGGLGSFALATELYGTTLGKQLLLGSIAAELLSYNIGKSFTSAPDQNTNQTTTVDTQKE